MMKNFYIFLTAILLSFNGCTGASEENADKPTITLKGDRDITLGAGERFIEPGFSAYDREDGDITDRVSASSKLSEQNSGQYVITYTVTDSDGNQATATRIISTSSNYSNNNNYYDSSDSSKYDLANYNYNYHTKVEGKTVTETMIVYNSDGTINEETITFERNKNDPSTIYQYTNDKVSGTEHIKATQIITNGGEVIVDRYVQAGQTFVQASNNGIDLSCYLVEHLGSINTQNIASANIDNFYYINVLHIRCPSSNGVTTDSYFASGWGEVLSIINDNGNITYKVLDKNSMQVR
jgi:VCBS repeat-containing protein